MSRGRGRDRLVPSSATSRALRTVVRKVTFFTALEARDGTEVDATAAAATTTTTCSAVRAVVCEMTDLLALVACDGAEIPLSAATATDGLGLHPSSHPSSSMITTAHSIPTTTIAIPILRATATPSRRVRSMFQPIFAVQPESRFGEEAGAGDVGDAGRRGGRFGFGFEFGVSVGAVFAVFAESDEVIGTHDSSDVLEFAVGAFGTETFSVIWTFSDAHLFSHV